MAEVVGIELEHQRDPVAAVRRIWDDGDAVAPLDSRLPPASRRTAADTLGLTTIVGSDGERSRVADIDGTADGDALVVATSGTSGASKAVVLTHDAVSASATATSDRLGVDPGHHRWLACLPLSHVGGLSVVTRAMLTGTTVEVHPRFEATAVTAAASSDTFVSLVATALGRVAPSRFHTVLLGGSTPPALVADNVVTTYGMSETGSGVVYDGRPLDGVDVDVADDGTIRLRGPMLLRAYRNGVDPKDHDGWLTTGDLGRWTDGRLVVDGRRDDMIVTGGENVWPEPVEALIERRSDVREAAVVGHDDPEWGQRVVVHIVPTDSGTPPTLDDLRSTVNESLPSWHAPKQLVLSTVLPRTGSGKLRRQALI